MPYEFLEDIATADVAFRATGKSLEEMFKSAGDALLNVMLEDIETLGSGEARNIALDSADIEMLLFQFLQELIYYKDAEGLLLRAGEIKVSGEQDKQYVLEAEARGERIDPGKHHLSVDVKAVTMHRFQVRQVPGGGWEATVVLDI